MSDSRRAYYDRLEEEENAKKIKQNVQKTIPTNTIKELQDIKDNLEKNILIKQIEILQKKLDSLNDKGV